MNKKTNKNINKKVDNKFDKKTYLQQVCQNKQA